MYYLYVVLFLMGQAPQAHIYPLETYQSCIEALKTFEENYKGRGYIPYSVDKKIGNRYILDCKTIEQLSELRN